MMAWLDRLNLQPQERRMVLAGLVLVLLVLNYWLIVPYFREWGPVNDEIGKTRARIASYMGEIGKKSAYERRLKELQQSGAEVMQEDQANRVQTTIYTQAATHGVTITRLVPSSSLRSGQTNQFFDEQVMTVEVSSGEEQLVNFLHSLGSGDSLIRVRDLSRLRLDPSRTRLQTTLTIVASFQKKPRPASPATKPSGPAVVQPKAAAPPAAKQ